MNGSTLTLGLVAGLAVLGAARRGSAASSETSAATTGRAKRGSSIRAQQIDRTRGSRALRVIPGGSDPGNRPSSPFVARRSPIYGQGSPRMGWKEPIEPWVLFHKTPTGEVPLLFLLDPDSGEEIGDVDEGLHYGIQFFISMLGPVLQTKRIPGSEASIYTSRGQIYLHLHSGEGRADDGTQIGYTVGFVVPDVWDGSKWILRSPAEERRIANQLVWTLNAALGEPDLRVMGGGKP